MADNNTIARPYATGYFRARHDAGDLADWSASLDVAGQLLADEAWFEYLGNPQFNDEQRLEFLTGLFAKAGMRSCWQARQQGHKLPEASAREPRDCGSAGNCSAL